MLKNDMIEVLRECEAQLIPSGIPVTIKKGALVMITQALGNAYTVYVNGNLARVKGADGDALGMIILQEPDINQLPGSTEDKVWEVLKTCFDPEIPVNIVDLGLVYECAVKKVEEKYDANIKMTLTAPGCGMGPALIKDIEEKVRRIHEINQVTINLVFDPPWDRSMMSEVAKLQLGLL